MDFLRGMRKIMPRLEHPSGGDEREAREEALNYDTHEGLDPPFAWAGGLIQRGVNRWCGNLDEMYSSSLGPNSMVDRTEKRLLWEWTGFVFLDTDRVRTLKRLAPFDGFPTGFYLYA